MEKVREIVKSLIEKLAVEQFEVEVDSQNGTWRIAISSPDERSLIGRENDRFSALSHLLKRILAKELGEEAKIVIDINGAKAKGEEMLKAKAMLIASRAREFRMNVEMDPMPSYERMLVHSILEGQPNIKTESIGEGRSRRLVVKFVE